MQLKYNIILTFDFPYYLKVIGECMIRNHQLLDTVLSRNPSIKQSIKKHHQYVVGRFI
ncbi:hypothetical protein GLOIN_2v1706155, partial [Rhizophagus irregularis DAOM 181602=DAOM 197198]